MDEEDDEIYYKDQELLPSSRGAASGEDETLSNN